MSPNEIFYRLSKLQRILVVIAVCVLLLVGFYFLLVSDQLAEISNLETRIGDLQKQIRDQEAILAQGPKLKAQIEEWEKRLQTMVASLPEKQEIEVLLKKITDLLSETNLVAKRFVPGQEQINEENYYAVIPIQLSVRGDYRKQGSFLASLNDLPRIVKVPSIRLNKAGGLTGREAELASKLGIVSLDAEITGETYRRLTPDEIKAITAKKAQQGGPQRK